MNKGGFKKSDVSIISAFTIRQTPVESRDLNSPSSRWWEVDRGAFFATIQLKYSYIATTPIIMDVDFTAPSHLLRLQFVLGCFFPWTFRAVANISREESGMKSEIINQWFLWCWLYSFSDIHSHDWVPLSPRFINMS